MLRRIHIRGFKSLRDVEVELAPLVVLIGPNAAGKSNFVEALDLFAQLGTQPTLDEAFPFVRGLFAEAFTLPAGGLRELMARPHADLSIEGDVDVGELRDRYRYRVGVRLKPAAGAFSVTEEHFTRLTKAGAPKDLPRIDTQAPGAADTADGRILVRQIGRAGAPHHEPVGLHHTVLSNRQYAGERFPDFDALRGELESWQTYYLDPRDAMRMPQPPREVEDVGDRGELIAPFLHRLKHDEAHPHHFGAFVQAVRGAIPSIESVDVALDPRYGTLDIEIVQDGTPYSSRVVSEGTLRVLSLCALAASPWPSALVAFEEPENGVHPSRIIRMARLLASMVREPRRQVVVTTHSPELVTALLRLVRDEEVARERVAFLRCARGDGTTIQPIDFKPLFERHELLEALRASDDERIVDAMMQQGWLDG